MNAQNEGQGLGSGNLNETGEVDEGYTQHSSLMRWQEHVPIVLGPEGYPLPSTMNAFYSAAVTGYGSNADMLLGIVSGFLVPWVPLLFLVTDNAVSNRSFKVGLITGVACNISLGVVKFVTFP